LLGSLAGLLFLPLGAGFSAPLLFTANLTTDREPLSNPNPPKTRPQSTATSSKHESSGDRSLTWFPAWRRPWIWPPSWLISYTENTQTRQINNRTRQIRRRRAGIERNGGESRRNRAGRRLTCGVRRRRGG
jgi:hypothetical protein